MTIQTWCFVWFCIYESKVDQNVAYGEFKGFLVSFQNTGKVAVICMILNYFWKLRLHSGTSQYPLFMTALLLWWPVTVSVGQNCCLAWASTIMAISTANCTCFTLYSVYIMLYTANCKWYTLHTVCAIHSTVFIEWFILHTHAIHLTVHPIHIILHDISCSLHDIHYILHGIQWALHVIHA